MLDTALWLASVTPPTPAIPAPKVPTALSVEAGLAWIKFIILSCIAVYLCYLALTAMRTHGRAGDSKKATNVSLATIICMAPIAIGASIATFTGYGTALLNLVTGVLS